MDEHQFILKKYLEIESLLNDFFSVFSYCLKSCIKPEIIAGNGAPVAACCRRKYYKEYDIDNPLFDLLKTERELLYGTPFSQQFTDPVSPCEYHNPKGGCVLKTHKSPICLAFMCRESIDELRDRYGIYSYDYLGMNYALEWILTGDFSEKDYSELKDSIKDMTEIIINKKTGFLKP